MKRGKLDQLDSFDEAELFRAIGQSGAAVLLIGRRAMIMLGLPSLDDLIATKRLGARPKDAEDIRLLQTLKARP